MTAGACLSLVLLLTILGLGLSTPRAESQSAPGLFQIEGVIVTGINLDVKTVDLHIGYLFALVNHPFEVAVWYASYERGFVPMAVYGEPIPNSSPGHRWIFYDWLPRSVAFTTIGLLPIDVNQFPFESYHAEIIFGFNVTGVTATNNVPGVSVSLDLSAQGKWNAAAHIENTTQARLRLPGQDQYIKTHGIVRFFSLIVELSHPQGYSRKMSIPTWGPIVFISVLFLFQFLKPRRFGRSDHVSFFVAVAVFMLGSTIVTRDFTPPELTLAECLDLVMVSFYMLVLMFVIYTRRYDRQQ